MKTQDNDFRFYMPLNSFEKGKDKEGNEIYKFKGLASTNSEDSDGEFLDPNGFDLKHFKYVNFNHLKDPKFIIGEPTNSKIVNGEFHVEGNIWADTDMGKQVVDLMKTLEKNSKNKTRLGISVEGKATKRNEINPKRVEKAVITAIALCPVPKNGDTWAELIQKGFINDIGEYEFDIEKSENPNGGNQYIIDVTNPETGMRYMVKKDFSIKIEKAISTDSSAKGTIKEDVEKKPKNQIDFSDNEIRKSIVVISKAKELNMVDDELIKKIQEKIKN